MKTLALFCVVMSALLIAAAEPSRAQAPAALTLHPKLRPLPRMWNRLYPEGQTSYKLPGGDGLWSETPVSNHREELSLAFSRDEGQTRFEPVVLARHAGK